MPSKLPLLLVLLPISALLLAAPGHAAPPQSTLTPLAFEAEDEGFEGEEEAEFEEGECEIAEEELEEGLLTPSDVEELCAPLAEDGGSKTGAAAECPLRSTRAHAAVRNHRLKLTIGYTTNEPTKATIQVRKGKTRIGSFKRRLGRSGVLRFTEELGRKLAGKRTKVEIKLRGAAAAECPPRRLILSPS